MYIAKVAIIKKGGTWESTEVETDGANGANAADNASYKVLKELGFFDKGMSTDIITAVTISMKRINDE